MPRRTADQIKRRVQPPIAAPENRSPDPPPPEREKDGDGRLAASDFTTIPSDTAAGRVAQRRGNRGRPPTALSNVRPSVPGSLDEVYRVARAVLVAKLAPGSYTQERGILLSDEEVVARLVVGILKGAELGFAPMTALTTIAMINKKPCLYGDGASALIQSRGHLERMTIEEIGAIPAVDAETRKFADDFGVRVTMWRRGQGGPYIGQFTVGDAKRARLWMDPHREPWIKYPKRQLKWRAFAWPARDGFADDLMGLGIAEEMLDVPPELPTKTDLSFLDDGLRGGTAAAAYSPLG